MKKEVTIITAFFNIGREKEKKEFARSNEQYLEYFKFWARLKNNVVVYTEKLMEEKIRNIRKSFGLEDKTKIIVIDNIEKIEPEILLRLKKVVSTNEFLKFRYMPNPMDNNPIYDYIMLLKSYFVNDAVEKNYATGNLIWLDFGYNHGGDVFCNENEFDFTLEMDLPENKITLFSLQDDDNKPIFQIVQSYEVYIIGAPMFVPSHLATNLWEDVKRAMNSLLDVGFIDDDQTLLLMASRNNKDKYNVIKSSWFMPLKEYGGSHLTVKTSKPKPKMQDVLLEPYRIYKRNKNCIKNLKSLFLKRKDTSK